MAALLEAAGWKAASTTTRADGTAEAALDVVRRGKPVMSVPRDAKPSGKVRKIVVVHKGSRGDRAGMDAADEAAVASHAKIVVLHVPRSSPSSTSTTRPA